MPVVNRVVNIVGDDSKLVTLMPGDEVPEWALGKVTNPAIFTEDKVDGVAAGDANVDAAETGEKVSPADDVQTEKTAEADYDSLRKPELVALCTERGLEATGNKSVLIARLRENDDAATEDEDVDVWALNENELRELAAERDIDVTGATSATEIAALIEQAGE